MFARCSYAGVVLALWGLVCVPGGRAAAQEANPDEAKPQPDATIDLKADKNALEEAPQRAIRFFQVQSQAKRLQSWIGMALAPADETLRAQLGLEDETGVVVTAVVQDSPAAKAGVMKHDILVRVGETPVREAADVVKAVDAAGGKPIAVTVLRGGESTTLEITPEKRRPPEPIEIEIGGDDGFAVRNLAEYLVRPGAIVPRRAKISGFLLGGAGDLPENLSITITKTGKEPAQIVVKRDDEKWEVSAEQLDKLPDDVRPYVERMLGRPPRISLQLGQLQQAQQEALKQLREAHVQRKEAHAQRKEAQAQRRAVLKQRIRVRQPKIVAQRAEKVDTQKRLDALSKQVEQLQKSIEELRRNLPDEQGGSGESQ